MREVFAGAIEKNPAVSRHYHADQKLISVGMVIKN
jgi:hypothetical protein